MMCFCLCARSAAAQEAQPDERIEPSAEVEADTKEAGVGPLPESFDFVAFPMVAYTPETSVVVAGAGLFFFKISNDPNAKKSDLLATAAYTLRGQGVVQLAPNLYFGDGTWQLSSEFVFLDWPSDFFGIRDDIASEEEVYNNRQIEGEVIVNRRWFDNFYAGIAYEISHSKLTIDNDTRLFGRDIPGEAGGLISGIGMRAKWDTRDTKFATLNGSRVALEMTNFNEAFGGDYTYWKGRFDVRHFKSWNKHTLGVHFVSRFIIGDPPFYDMSTIGGSGQLRGVYSGKFVDNSNFVLQSEYRTPYWWRFGLAGFAGIGETFKHIDEITFDKLQWGIGGGLRFLVKEEERVNIRLDVGWAGEGPKIYFGLSEAF